MSKYKDVKKFVEIALDHCGHKSDLRAVREKLSEALKSIRKVEAKENEEQKKINVRDRWEFDVKTSSLKNLSKNQFDNVINRIENMIDAESKKIQNKNPENILTE